jgi:hypothetical protein
MTHRSPARRALALSAVALLGLGSLTACGDDSGSDDAADEVAPEDIKVSMAEVLAGLPEILEHGDAAASAGASGDYTSAEQHYEELHEVWEGIEGTIKDTDLEAYEAIETAQGLIKDGATHDNAERIQQGADDQREAVEAFIAAHGEGTGAADDMTSTTQGGGADDMTTTTEGGGAADVNATDAGAPTSLAD